MSLQTRLNELAMAVGTDYKQIRTWLTGSSSGSLASLTTTAKGDIVAAINEVNAKPTGGASAPAASETVAGISELATLAEVATGTDIVRVVTVAGVRQERNALKAEILGGATGTWDTLQELRTAIEAAEESDVIASLTTVVGTKANLSEVYTRTALGDPETDLVAVYVAAKA